MYLVSHWLNIIQFQSIDLPGEAKQAGFDTHNVAPLFSAIVPVSELLSELLIGKKALRVIFFSFISQYNVLI